MIYQMVRRTVGLFEDHEAGHEMDVYMHTSAIGRLIVATKIRSTSLVHNLRLIYSSDVQEILK